MLNSESVYTRNKKNLIYYVKLVCKPLFIALGLFLFLILKLVRPIIFFRIGKLQYSRIGELASHVEIYLRREAIHTESKKEFQIFVTGIPANIQLLTMIKRRIRVTESRFLLRFYNLVYPHTKNSKLWIDMPFETNEYEEFSNVSPQLSFTSGEEMLGQKLLKEIGINQNSPFVCFHVRDKEYLDTVHPYHTRREWSYHDFHDASIHNYLKSAEYLAKQGIYTLRMGAVVEQAIFSTNPRIIDYATNFRTDFGDIYLPAKCKFFLASASGIRTIAYLFNVPVAFANSAPIGDISLGKDDITIFKKYYLMNEKRFLKFKELIEMGADWWQDAWLFKQAGIEIIENTADEILFLTQEMLFRLNGTWKATQEDEYLQQQFRNFFPIGHRCYGFTSRIGAEFLRQNKELL